MSYQKEIAKKYLEIGELHQKNNHFNQAEIAYQQAIEFDEDLAQPYFQLGVIFKQKKQWKEAIKYFMENLKRIPYRHLSYQNIAEILKQMEDSNIDDIRRFENFEVPKYFLEEFCDFREKEAIVSLNSSKNLNYIEIESSERIQLSRKTNNSELSSLELEIDIPKAFVVVVPNGKAWADGFNSAVITSNNRLIKAASTRNSELAFCASQKKIPLVIDETVAFFSHQHNYGNINFYHWIFNDIVRLSLLKRSGVRFDEIDKFAFHKVNQPFQKDILENLGIPESKILETCNHTYIQANRLIVPSPTPAHAPSKWTCDFLRNEFLGKSAQQSKVELLERIYITRRQASTRQVTNELELIDFLEQYGFKPIAPEAFSYLDQVALFANAKFVIAPHGAGLANLVFCKPGTKVIEIFSSSIIKNMYALIAKYCNLDYYYIVGTALDDNQKVLNHHMDIHIDINNLEKLIALANINKKINHSQKNQSIETYFSQGNKLRQQGKIEESIEAYRRSIELDPSHPKSVWSYYHLGACLEQIDRFNEAKTCYLEALQIQPSFPPASRKLASMSKQDASILTALIELLRNQAEIQKDSRIYKRLAEVLMNSGNRDEAISACKEATYYLNLKNRPDLTKKYWNTEKSIGPQFIILGAPRCGTTSLYNYINEHPNVLPCADKELHFFTKEYKWGLDWYLANFPQVSQKMGFVTGEASPTYLYSNIQEKVKTHFPSIKLIAILRNPIDRAKSYYSLQVRHRLEKYSFEEKVLLEIEEFERTKEDELCYVDDYSLLGQGLYAYQLKKWFEFFPREQFLILKSEDFYSQTNETMNQVFQFLDLPSYQRSNYVQHNASSYTSISDELRRKISDFFRPHNQNLETLLGIELNWQ
jgi:capsular polysaccharide biosynthesis protein/Tfp pilus assembly protein PilF